MPRPDLVLLELGRVLKPGALLSVIDPGLRSKLSDNMSNKQSSMWYTCSVFHCLPLASNQPDSLALGSCWGRDRQGKEPVARVLRVEPPMVKYKMFHDDIP